MPVDTITRVVPQLIEHGKYTRPALGIEVDQALNQRLTRQLGIEGVVILRVAPRSAADKAGLKGVEIRRDGGIVPGDIIVAIGGESVDSVNRLLARLDDHDVGEKVTLTVLRHGQRLHVNVTLQPGV